MEIQNAVNRGSVQNLTYDPGSKDSEATTFWKKNSRIERERQIKRKVQSHGQYSLKGIIKELS